MTVQLGIRWHQRGAKPRGWAAGFATRLSSSGGDCISEQKTARGAVVATAQNKPGERYGVRVGDAWFDGVGDVPPGVERGAEVEVDYVESDKGGRTFRNVKWIRVMEPAEEAGPEADVAEEAGRDGKIARAVALKCATALSTGTGEDAQTVLERASLFEKWLRATFQ